MMFTSQRLSVARSTTPLDYNFDKCAPVNGLAVGWFVVYRKLRRDMAQRQQLDLEYFFSISASACVGPLSFGIGLFLSLLWRAIAG